MIPDGSHPERAQAYAKSFWKRLQGFKGWAHIGDENQGEVLLSYQGVDQRVHVVRMIPNTHGTEHLRKMGWLDEDIESGILTVTTSEFRNPQWPRVGRRREPVLRQSFVSRRGVVVAKSPNGEGQWSYSKLLPTEKRAIEVVDKLLEYPRDIAETFGSYDAFSQALGPHDGAGIEAPESTPMQILYFGGLQRYVDTEAAKLREAVPTT